MAKNNKQIKAALGIGLLIATIGTTMAAPNLGKHVLQSSPSEITFAANMIQSTDGKENMLNGNVKLSIGSRIKISADKVLVKYAEEGQHEIAEFIIYGKGTLTEGDHSMQFVNGTFNPNTSQLSAETITT
jgi:lipopolysaccharide export system protein LptA